MPHARQTIREAAASKVTGLTTTGANVFQSRMVPQSTALPCLLVMTDAEEIAPGAFERQLERRLTLTVVGVAKAGATLDDNLDTIAAEVETALGSDYRYELTGIDVDFDETLEKPAGRITLTYGYRYFTNAGAPGTVL